MDPLIVIVLGLVLIAGAALLSDRLGIAAPLILVLAGIGASFLPGLPAVELEPEWILGGVLPPLLFSASASMPANRFRRDFTAIGGLSVVLVVVSAVVLGLFVAWLVPDLGLGWSIALGAIISPTDAVATTIVRRVGVSHRVVALLEGESLLNDATALVLLRAAVASAGVSVSLWGVAGTFVLAVIVAVVVGMIVGHVMIWLRARIDDPAVNTLVSFTTPFLAAIPAEHLGGSGLVAAVLAGLVTGRHAPEHLAPRHRLSDTQNWRMVELVLEGAIFLIMGLQLSGIVADVREDHSGIGFACTVAVGALALTIFVRAAFVVPLLAALQRFSARGERFRPVLLSMQERLDAGDTSVLERRWSRKREQGIAEATVERFRTRIRSALASIDYFLAEPLRWREGAIVVWAGMRGAVTLAAAQTLPEDTPERSLLVLVAFLVATGSLLLQGVTLPWVVAHLRPAMPDAATERAERQRVAALMRQAAQSVGISPDRPGDGAAHRDPGQPDPTTERTLHDFEAMIAAQRSALLDARDDGTYSEQALVDALDALDISQIAFEYRAGQILQD